MVDDITIADFTFISDKQVKLYDTSSSLHFIRGALWSCQKDNIHIYHLDLEKKTQFSTKELGMVYSVSETATYLLAATSTGLHQLSFEGAK